MIKKGKLFWIFWGILSAISVIFLVSVAFGAKLPDKAVMNYYDLKEYQLLKVEEFPTIPWIKKLIIIAKSEKKSHEKIILVLDRRSISRIIAIYHLKTDGKNIETVGCHADFNYLETLGAGEPNWITYDFHCQKELSNFLNILVNEIYQK